MRLLPIFSALALLSGCGDEPIQQGRRDLGLPSPDAGLGEPLYFQPGMRFEFCALLLFNDGLNNESSARYTLEYVVETTQDRGPGSTLTARASGARSFEQNWYANAGLDSWIARLGPTEATDQVGADAVEFALDEPPPAPPVRKRLPHNSLFLLDLRQSSAIRAAWAQAHAGLQPGSVDPSQHPLGHLALTLAGTDEAMVVYPAAVKHRELSLGYDENGVLAEAIERLGDSEQPNLPHGRFELRRGPCP